MALIISCNAWVLFFLLMTSFSDAQKKGNGRVALVKRIEQNEKALQAMEAALSALKNTVQAQENVIKAQESEIADLKSKMTAASKGVAFTARFLNDNYASGLPIASKQVLLFDDVITNVGNGYDKTTGIFTAPVDGAYAFFVQVMGVGNDGHLAIDKSGTVLNLVYTKSSQDISDQGATLVTSHMAAGEKVFVRQDLRLTGLRGLWYTVFTGFLVRAD